VHGHFGLVLGVDDPVRRWLPPSGGLLNVPANPPLPLPGGENGPGGAVGRMGDALFARRAGLVRDLLLEELRARRSTGASTEDILGAMLVSDPPVDDDAIVDHL
jgi:hypothetical protein